MIFPRFPFTFKSFSYLSTLFGQNYFRKFTFSLHQDLTRSVTISSFQNHATFGAFHRSRMITLHWTSDTLLRSHFFPHRFPTVHCTVFSSTFKYLRSTSSPGCLQHFLDRSISARATRRCLANALKNFLQIHVP